MDFLLLRCRAFVTTQPGPREIGAHPVAADQIGVETNQIAGFDHPTAAFLIPGVGPRARRQKSGLDPLTTTFNRLSMEM